MYNILYTHCDVRLLFITQQYIIIIIIMVRRKFRPHRNNNNSGWNAIGPSISLRAAGWRPGRLSSSTCWRRSRRWLRGIRRFCGFYITIIPTMHLNTANGKNTEVRFCGVHNFYKILRLQIPRMADSLVMES